MQNQPKGPGDQLSPQVCASLLTQAMSALATTVSVFVRTDFGEEAFGGFTGIGAFIILVFAAGADKTGVMFWYFWFWLIALLLQRSKTAANKRAGRIGHSRYNGFPKVAMLISRAKTETQARTIEPVLCFFAGLVIYYPGMKVDRNSVTDAYRTEGWRK